MSILGVYLFLYSAYYTATAILMSFIDSELIIIGIIIVSKY